MKIISIGEVKSNTWQGKTKYGAWGKMDGLNESVLFEAPTADMLVAGKGYENIERKTMNKKAGGTFEKIIIGGEKKTEKPAFKPYNQKEKYTQEEFEAVIDRAGDYATKKAGNTNDRWVSVFERYINNALMYGVKIQGVKEKVKEEFNDVKFDDVPSAIPPDPPFDENDLMAHEG